ncbi:MAG: hypothetical protein LBD74_03855 [Spirochaetaceae bacterium]|nr:hypothetical protein [Spirochaetaceae bacterium]
MALDRNIPQKAFFILTLFHCLKYSLDNLCILEVFTVKKLMAVCILGFALTAGAFAQHPDGWGIGLQGGFGSSSGGGGALSLKIPSLPIYWTGRISFGGSSKEGKQSYFNLGVSGDYYFYDQALVPDIGLGWYLGAGGFVGIYSRTFHVYSHPELKQDDYSFTLLQIGGEVPIGLSWMIPIPVKLELYLQGVPYIAIQFPVADEQEWFANDDDYGYIWWDIGFNLGIRIWL